MHVPQSITETAAVMQMLILPHFPFGAIFASFGLNKNLHVPFRKQINNFGGHIATPESIFQEK